jgi:hypothetical protein
MRTGGVATVVDTCLASTKPWVQILAPQEMGGGEKTWAETTSFEKAKAAETPRAPHRNFKVPCMDLKARNAFFFSKSSWLTNNAIHSSCKVLWFRADLSRQRPMCYAWVPICGAIGSWWSLYQVRSSGVPLKETLGPLSAPLLPQGTGVFYHTPITMYYVASSLKQQCQVTMDWNLSNCKPT